MMTQYTIEELTSIIKVSKQSIYNILNKDKAFLKEHSTRKQRKIYYDKAILDKLIEYYGVTEEAEAPAAPTEETVEAAETPIEAAEPQAAPTDQHEEIKALQSKIEALEKLLEEKNERIAVLEAKEQELIKQNGLTLLLLQEEKQEKLLLLPPTKSEKKTWWQRLTGK